MYILPLLFLLPAILLGAESFESYQAGQNRAFSQEEQLFVDFQAQEDRAFKEHLEQEARAISRYKQKVKALWPDSDLENPKKIVNFTKDMQTQSVIDFERNQITITQRLSDKHKDAKALFHQLQHTLALNTKQAFEENQLEQTLQAKLTPSKYIKTDQPNPLTLLPSHEVDLNSIQLKEENHTLTLTYSLPKDATFRRSATYLVAAKSNAQRFKLRANWLLAIMHSESSFNPMARSHVPAYGLMQIVPHSAGIDAYAFVYDKRRLLSASYLYNSDNNIEMGSAYFHILYYKYLAGIKDPTSRLYCCIAAYNTGAGNVAKSFTGSNSVKKAAARINRMSSDSVYQYLLAHLPYEETRHYLKRVYERQKTYKELYKL